MSLSPGVPLETLTVYQTAEHPNLEENLRSYFTEQVKPRGLSGSAAVCCCSSGSTFTGNAGQHRFLQPIGGEVLLGDGPQAVWRPAASGKGVTRSSLKLRHNHAAAKISLTSLQFAAIGPTTEEAMAAEGLCVSCTAEKPTAGLLAVAIAKALQ